MTNRNWQDTDGETTPAFEGWAIIELMGHRRLGGHVREQTVAGASMLRVDMPTGPGLSSATQFYAPGAIYCITPTTEEIARGVAASNRPAPVQRWELPQPTRKPDGFRSYADRFDSRAALDDQTQDPDDQPVD